MCHLLPGGKPTQYADQLKVARVLRRGDTTRGGRDAFPHGPRGQLPVAWSSIAYQWLNTRRKCSGSG